MKTDSDSSRKESHVRRNISPVRKRGRNEHDNKSRDRHKRRRSRSARRKDSVGCSRSREEVQQRYYGENDNASSNSHKHDALEDGELPAIGDRYYGSDAPPNPPLRERKLNMDLLTRTGGAYIPPAKLRLMQAEITDKSSTAYQRIAWEALKKSIHGYINKVNTSNIGIISKEILHENIVRGRGLLCKSIIQAQAASPTFTNVYAALVAVINSKFPNIGELLLRRLILQFKRGYKQNNKQICISATTFVAHLVNQGVAHEILALEILTLLVEFATDDSVEVAINLLKECGQKLTEVSSKGINAIFEMLRNILHEGKLEQRIQYMIEVMFQVRKDGFKDHAAVIEELDLVEEEDQFTHLIELDDVQQSNAEDNLNVFKFDDKYVENEEKYVTLRKEILDSSDSSGSDSSGSDDEDDDDNSSNDEDNENNSNQPTIIDNTETNLVALRRTIYLTIQSSLDFEECAHKLMKMELKPGQEVELCHMFLDCCAEQRTYEKFYGLLAQRFCEVNQTYVLPFQQIFKDTYATTHRLDTGKLRNVGKFFAHLLFTDAISWEVLEIIKLNEEDTNSSNRIFIKILFQELAEYMGLEKLYFRLKDPTLQNSFSGLFPRDDPKNTRFSINFFTTIGLGGLTAELREHLRHAPKQVNSLLAKAIESKPSDSSEESDTTSSDSSSESEDNNVSKNHSDRKHLTSEHKKRSFSRHHSEVPSKDKSKEAQIKSNFNRHREQRSSHDKRISSRRKQDSSPDMRHNDRRYHRYRTPDRNSHKKNERSGRSDRR